VALTLIQAVIERSLAKEFPSCWKLNQLSPEIAEGLKLSAVSRCPKHSRSY